MPAPMRPSTTPLKHEDNDARRALCIESRLNLDISCTRRCAARASQHPLDRAIVWLKSPHVCASRSRSRPSWSATLYCDSTIALAGPTPLAKEASISAYARAYGRRRTKRCEDHRPKKHAETPLVPSAVLCRAQWQSGTGGGRKSCWRSMLPHAEAENL